MPLNPTASADAHVSVDRRDLLKWSTLTAGAATLGVSAAQAQISVTAEKSITAVQVPAGGLRKGSFAFTLAHEQFRVPDLVRFGALASRSGFHVLATSDHFQPWQANEAHSGAAWVTIGALGAQATQSMMGTAVTCPTLRYNPAVVAEAFSTMSHLYPGRVFLGVGSGEALNEQAATGNWPNWQERWDRLIEAIAIIRALWSGKPVSHTGKYYTVDARLYDPPAEPIPLMTAANGKKSMRLAGQYGDGLISDPMTWKQHKVEWEDGARSAGKDPSKMPVMIEHYVVVGDDTDAKRAAELWRFGPKAFKGLYNVRSPEEIQQKADAGTPLDQVTQGWPIGTDPKVHIDAARELFDSGVSVVNVHAGQDDQSRVIEFYAQHVLPKLPPPA
jgi:TAT-translocated FGD2 family F420-dependent dehydrogenase